MSENEKVKFSVTVDKDVAEILAHNISWGLRSRILQKLLEELVLGIHNHGSAAIADVIDGNFSISYNGVVAILTGKRER